MADKRTQTAKRGAQRHSIKAEDRRRGWLQHHADTARESWQRLWRTPIATLMTIAVLAISLALPGALLTGLHNILRISDSIGTQPTLSIYLKKEVTNTRAEAMQRQLSGRADIASVELVTPEAGLAAFSESAGLSDVLSYLDENPLPAVLVVKPTSPDPVQLRNWQQELNTAPEVEEAVLDLEWLERLAAFVELASRTVLVIGALLGLTVLLVVGNTIRMAIESRREEIIVSKLVGATDAWVRRPFLYSGSWFGLSGALTAWLLVQISLWLIAGPVDQVAELYGSSFELQGLGLYGSGLILGSGLLLGWAGAWLAVGRHLKDIQPR